MPKPTLQIVIASTRPGRIGRPVGEWFERTATAHGGFDVELVDLAEVDLPLLDEPKHPKLGEYEHQHTKDWSATVSRADAFAFVMPEYNHGFNAALKNAIDFLFQEWQGKPVGFVSYGGVAGGTRALQMLKPVVLAVGMVPLTAAVNIPFVHDHEQGGEIQPTEVMESAAKSMLDELVTWTERLSSAHSGNR